MSVSTAPSDLAEALALHRAGRMADAESAYARYLASHPDDADALNNAGVAAVQGGNAELAISRFEQLVAVAPRHAQGHNNLGYALICAGRFEAALNCLERAVALRPGYAQAYNNLGIAHENVLHRDDAIRAFEQALYIAPAYADAAANLGEVLNRDGNTAHARTVLERASAAQPSHVGVRAALAATEALDGNLARALDVVESMAGGGLHEPLFWQTLGTLRSWAGDTAASEAAFRTALTFDAHDRRSWFGLAASLLARGRFEEGWRAFEQRPDGCLGNPTRFGEIPSWDGGAVDGALLLTCEQGLGDVVQFSRFIPGARSRVRRLVLLLDRSRASLAPLLATLAGVDAICTDAAELAELGERPVARASVLSLPYLLGVRVDDLPGAMPYLSAPEERVALWKPRLEGIARPRVGIAWAAYARRDMAYITQQKSVPLALLAPVLAGSKANFVSLQVGPAGKVEHDALPGIADFTADIRDFGDTAAIMSELDLVISSDTSVAHVAGALGKPVWMLDRYNTCWRWRLAQDRSPWYPTLCIFRQKRFGDWGEPLARLGAALDELAS